MSPTAEQLIRDYLNRVSVAARTKLHSEDRRAFLARMRFSIERHCGAPGTADPGMVAKVLAGLGDPEKLVDAEAARLKSARKQGPQAEGGGAPPAGGTDAPQTGGTVQAGVPGPRLASPQGTPQRRRRTPSPWLVSGTGLRPAGGAAGSTPPPVPVNPVLASRQPTGEIRVQSRPITSRWRPGEPLQPRQPKAKQPRRLRVTRGGKSRDKIKPGDEIKPGNTSDAASQAEDRKASEIKASEIKASEIKAGENEARENPVSDAQDGQTATSKDTVSENTLSGSTVSEDLAAGQANGARRPGSRRPATAGSRPDQLRAPDDVRGPAAGAEPGAAAGLAWPWPPDAASRRGPGASGAPGATGATGGSGGSSGSDDRPEPGDRLGHGDRTGSASGPETDLGWIPGLGPASGGPEPASAELKPLRSALGPQLAAALARFGQAAAAIWRGHPMEGTAVVLLILAGLIYPFPIWLLGFVLWIVGIMLALASKIWDNLDKAVGVAAPVILALVGTLLVLAMGGSHDSIVAYAHEVGTTWPLIFRAAIVLGGIYLGWRARRGPRSPNVPPWNRPHRI